MKTAAPSGGVSAQPAPGPDPYAAAYAPQRRVKHGHTFHRATAFVLADSHQDYVVHSTLRNVLRALIVFAVVGAVIGLTVTKYVTDNDLRGGTTTVREADVSKLTGARIELAQCPCQNDTLLWSDFVTYGAPLSSNGTAVVKLCREAIVPELRTAREPTAASTPEEQQAYAGYLDRLQANSATQLACYLAVREVVDALEPNSAQVLGLGDVFYNAELLSQRQLEYRLVTFIGNKLLRQTEDFAAQLTLQGLFLQSLQSNYSKTAANVANANSTAGAGAAQAAEQVVELAHNMTKDAAFALAELLGDKAYVGGVLITVVEALTLKYADYLDACKPYYCDYTTSKGAWSRIVEFLGLLGGLYTTLLGVGLLAWFLVDVALPGHHGKFIV